jgi:sporulation protein YlmC with PRC-barrel domain
MSMAAPGPTGVSMAAALGRPVLYRADAEPAGEVKEFVVDQPPRHVVALHVAGRASKAHVVDWSHVAFGPDAVVADEEASLRPAADDEAEQLGRHGSSLLGARVLDTAGFDRGRVDDVWFDPSSGELSAVVVGDRSWPASDLHGLGTYALVVTAHLDR